MGLCPPGALVLSWALLTLPWTAGSREEGGLKQALGW